TADHLSSHGKRRRKRTARWRNASPQKNTKPCIYGRNTHRYCRSRHANYDIEVILTDIHLESTRKYSYHTPKATRSYKLRRYYANNDEYPVFCLCKWLYSDTYFIYNEPITTWVHPVYSPFLGSSPGVGRWYRNRADHSHQFIYCYIFHSAKEG